MIVEPPIASLLALDCETDLIAPHNKVPRMICTSFAWFDGFGGVGQALHGNDPEGLYQTRGILEQALATSGLLIVGHNLAFDMLVLWRAFPDLATAIWDKYEAQGCYCTQLGEKLRAISSHGEVDLMVRPDGSRQVAKYHLDDLSRKYLGKNRTAEKMDPSSWRMNYFRLDGVPAAQYPEEARRYALEDAYDTLLIAQRQIAEGSKRQDYDSIYTTRERSRFAFAYAGLATRGASVNQEKVRALQELCTRVADPSALPNLVQAGFLSPPQPGRTFKNGKKCKDIEEKWRGSLWDVYVLGLLLKHQVPIKLTDKGQEIFNAEEVAPEQAAAIVFGASVLPAGPVKEFLETPSRATGLEPKELEIMQQAGLPASWITWNFAKVVSSSDDTTKALMLQEPENVLLREAHARDEVQKVRKTLLPNVGDSPIVWASFVYPKKTMRGGSRLDRGAPTFPAQQMPGMIAGMDPRQIIEPRPGFVFVDADFTALELCTTAQVTYELFHDAGVDCRMAKLINEGVDLHAYLGAQLAQEDAQVVAWYRHCGASTDRQRYDAFSKLKKGMGDEASAKYKHWRKFAKPINLGYPGLLGPAGMHAYALATFEIDIPVETCRRYKNMWLATFPEMPIYFEWVQRQHDEEATFQRDEEGQPIRYHKYQTPIGNWRRGCWATDCANGKAMQSPAADGFHYAMAALYRACTDPSLRSPLLGSGIIVPFHDQFLVEVPFESLEAARVRAAEVQRIMESEMSRICKNVKVKAEPALSMVWSKSTERTLNEQGDLILWTPKQTT